MATPDYQISWDPMQDYKTGIEAATAMENLDMLRNANFRASLAAHDQDAANTFLSTIPANRAYAASMGHDTPTFFANQQSYILNDPSFQRLSPESQAKVLAQFRDDASKSMQNMTALGQLQQATQAEDAMGLDRTASDLMVALQSGNSQAVQHAAQAQNSNWGWSLDEDSGELTNQMTGESVPMGTWMAALAQNPYQGGAGVAAASQTWNQALQEQIRQEAQAAQQQVLLQQLLGTLQQGGQTAPQPSGVMPSPSVPTLPAPTTAPQTAPAQPTAIPAQNWNNPPQGLDAVADMFRRMHAAGGVLGQAQQNAAPARSTEPQPVGLGGEDIMQDLGKEYRNVLALAYTPNLELFKARMQRAQVDPRVSPATRMALENIMQTLDSGRFTPEQLMRYYGLIK